jgi:putative phosphotransacetylase
MGDIVIRVSKTFALDFHIDTDEANAAWLKSGDKIRIVR